MISRCSRPEEAAAEAEAQGGRGLRLVVEAGVVQPQLAQRLSRSFSKSSASTGYSPHHTTGIDGLNPGSASAAGVRSSVMVSPTLQSATVLIGGGDVADLARAQIVGRDHLRREHADLLDAVHRAVRHHADFLAALQAAVLHPHQDHHAEILVVPAIDQQRLQRRRGVARRRRQAVHQRLQHALDVQAGLGADLHRVGGVQADHVLDLLLHPFRLGGRQVDLVEDRHDLVVGLDRLVDVGQRLRLHALAGVDHQQRALAGGQAAADLVGEVDVAGRVHQVQLVGLAVLGLVGQADGLRLDGDAALALQVHAVEHLVGHLAVASARR